MNKAKSFINFIEKKDASWHERKPLLRNAREGMVHVKDYWIRKYKGKDWWGEYIKYWTEYDQMMTKEGQREGRSLDSIADDVSDNAAHSYMDNTMKEFGISEDEVWQLVHDAIYKEGEFANE